MFGASHSRYASSPGTIDRTVPNPIPTTCSKVSNSGTMHPSIPAHCEIA